MADELSRIDPNKQIESDKKNTLPNANGYSVTLLRGKLKQDGITLPKREPNKSRELKAMLREHLMSCCRSYKSDGKQETVSHLLLD